MRLSKFVYAAMIAGSLGFGALGTGGAVASAAPVAPAPQGPHDNYCPPWCGNDDRGNGDDHGRGPGNYCPPWCGNSDRDGDKGAWWASNRHDWWDDR